MTWSQVPSWARFLAAFAIGIGLGVWGGAIAYADLKHATQDNRKDIDAIQAKDKETDERLQELEKHEAARDQWQESVDQQLSRIYDEVRKR